MQSKITALALIMMLLLILVTCTCNHITYTASHGNSSHQHIVRKTTLSAVINQITNY